CQRHGNWPQLTF
nr:immunoglobulin light chain junction region [Macaca mulatta]MPN91242.1 immunoglobulin light chain junction region [Macaca mulatta]MPN91268.1 immunoglobulin light chain junction region [Macaca mulatta]MPN91914.1 immunoglobulin light chain junction region [Macaca mulatta]MPN92355.1 immunoglobulin light chain junction region [Macaca mulatta]